MSASQSNVYVFMGVCGCGKTTVSKQLKTAIEKKHNGKICVTQIDGDAFHPERNKEKMRNGIALNDKDRRPWLYAIGRAIRSHQPLLKTGQRHLLFIACSALKYSYREILRAHDDELTFVMLDGSYASIDTRLRRRNHEFMANSLLQSQFETLEYPNQKYVEHNVIVQSMEAPLHTIVHQLMSKVVPNKPVANDVMHWRATTRVCSILCEYKRWFFGEHNALCFELIQLYSIDDCLHDLSLVIDGSGNDVRRSKIRNTISIKKSEILRCISPTCITARIQTHTHNYERLRYLNLLHCLLCYFGDICIPLSSKSALQAIKMTSSSKLPAALRQSIMARKHHELDALHANLSLFDHAELSAIQLLLELDQSHMFKHWHRLGTHDAKKKTLLQQISRLDASYPGGLRQYHRNAQRLFTASSLHRNPFQHWKRVTVADQIELEFGNEAFARYEQLGRAEFGRVGFVLLGGGFGERLRYGGIKTGLPSEVTTHTSYLELYIRTLLAFQTRARRDLNDVHVLLPFACTTSGEGHALTKQFLEDNAYFGLDASRGQFTFLRQSLVASFANHRCEFALAHDDPYQVVEKPHGHGDVHSLMFRTGTAAKWVANGVRWIVVLQDTNAVAVRSLPCSLGVSAAHDFAMNSVATPRKRGSYGAIVNLEDAEQRSLTINVEYNQLTALLRQHSLNGDAFPANTNTLIIRSDTYLEVLGKTQGAVPEFGNPKYVDEQKRDVFKTASRLECMVQDYPKLLFEQQQFNAQVGVTVCPKWMALEPVKKNIFDSQIDAKKHASRRAEFCAANGEAAVYELHRKYVQRCGVDLELYEADDGLRMFQGINVKYGARIVLLPQFATTLHEMRLRLKGGKNIRISSESTLVLDGDIEIRSLQLNGTLIVKCRGAHTTVIIDGLKVENQGWRLEPIADLHDKQIDDVYKMRGYVVNKNETRIIEFDDGKHHVVSL